MLKNKIINEEVIIIYIAPKKIADKLENVKIYPDTLILNNAHVV